MDRIKKVYVDSRYTANDSVSTSGSKFGIKEALDLGDNAVCYIDDVSIPHTWYTVGEYNNQLYIDSTSSDLTLKHVF